VYKLWSSSLRILLSTLFSKTLNLYSSLNMRDQAPHPYKTVGEFLALYSLIFQFFRQETEPHNYTLSWPTKQRREDKIFRTEWQRASPEFNLL
jgi:hypothetical protein